MTEPKNTPNPLALMYGWVARMATIVLEMVLPGLGGQWLDSRWGTNYWAVVGFGLGFTVGLLHLLQMVKNFSPGNSGEKNNHSSIKRD